MNIAGGDGNDFIETGDNSLGRQDIYGDFFPGEMTSDNAVY